MSIQEQIQRLQLKVKALKMEKDVLEQQAKTNENLVELGQKKLELAQQELILNRKIFESGDDLGGKYAEIYAQNVKNLKILELENKSIKEANKEMENLASHAKSVGENLKNAFGVGDWKSSSIGSFILAFDKGAKGFRQQFAGIKTASAAMNAAMDLSVSYLQKTFEATVALAWQQDGLISAMNRSLGTMGEYDAQILALENANYQAGIGTENYTVALSALRDTMSDFNTMSASTQNSLMNTTAHLERLGIDSATTAQNMQFFTKTLGMTGAEANVATLQITDLAQKTGFSFQHIASQFAASQDQLAMYGDKAIEVFKDLAIQSRLTGVEVGKLLGVVKGFQTLEGAAKAAGRLNAILGGPMISSLELLNKSFESPRAAIDYVTGAVKRAGMEFNELDPALKQAIASTVGFQSVDEMAKVMNEDSEAAGKLTKQAQRLGMSTQELENINKKYMSTQEDLTALVRSFAISVQPLLVHLKDLLKYMTELNKAMDGWGAKIALGVVGVRTAIGFFGPFGSVISKVAKGLSKTSDAAAGLEKTTGGAKGASMAKNMLAFGAAILMVGGGVFLATYGISKMADSFAKLNAQQLSALKDTLLGMGVAIGILSGIIIIAGKASEQAAIGMLALGFTMVLIGGSIALMSIGVEKLTDSFINLYKVVSKDLQGSLSTLNLLTNPMNSVGLFSFATGIGVLAGSLGALAIALGLIKTEDLQALAGIMVGMGDVASATTAVKNFSAAADMVQVAAVATQKVDTQGGKSLANVLEQTKNVATSGGSGKTSQGGGPSQIVVVLKVDSEEVARKIVPQLSAQFGWGD